MKFTLDTTTRFTPGRIIGGSPPSILRLSRRGEETVTRIISGADIEITPLVRRMLNLNQIHPAFDHDCPRAEAVVTVITPAFGQRIHQHPEGDGIKVVVVDDGSQPPLHDATIRLEVNGGPGSARNEALQFVDTEFVAFVDADVDVGSDSTWIRSLLHHFDDPEVAAAAPRVRSIERDGVVARHELRRGALDLGPLPASVSPGTRVSYVPSAALLCRTSDITEINGFDPELRTGEDVDLIWRLVAAGKTIRYDPSVIVHHEPRTSLSSWWQQRVGYGLSSAALARRHGNDHISPLVTSPWSIAAVLSPMLFRRPIAGLAAALTILCAASQRLRKRIPDLTNQESFNIVATGTMHTATAGGRAIRRVWWPVLIVLAPFLRSARRLLVLSLLAARSPMTVLDDAAHGVGIWSGVNSSTTFGPVLPRIRGSRPQHRGRSS